MTDATLPKPKFAPGTREIARAGGTIVYANLARKSSS